MLLFVSAFISTRKVLVPDQSPTSEIAVLQGALCSVTPVSLDRMCVVSLDYLEEVVNDVTVVGRMR